MMTFKNIKNVDGLFRVLDKCEGGIYFACSDGTEIDVRNNLLFRELLASACQNQSVEELSVRLEDKRDATMILEYLIARKVPAA